MGYGDGTELYTLCVFAFLTRKSEYLYMSALHDIIVALEYTTPKNHDSSDFISRTTNSLERFDRGINENFSNSHLNLHNFIKVIIGEEEDSKKLIEKVETSTDIIVEKVRKR
ncbi:hypothetical protein RF11_01320 [Thelohanellus kitauei]|uniref:Uncharacterized protein n=1 Tax=Thelohanellus kitauei TaxID=669202 RepID=A0A0C2MR46_THEKT|nr:hypothetical protein RF11_01320 [Thelohanellus kitauei]